MREITISQSIQPLLDEYTLVRLKIINMATMPENKSKWQHLDELERILGECSNSIMQILFDDNKEKVEKIINPKK